VPKSLRVGPWNRLQSTRFETNQSKLMIG